MSHVMSQAKHMPPVHFPHLIPSICSVISGDQTIASVVGGEKLEQEQPIET